MHAHAAPFVPGTHPVYEDVYAEEAAGAGGSSEAWIDPGTGFGKGMEDNVNLIQRLPDLCSLGGPVLLGVSGKSFLGEVTGRGVGDRLAGSLAAVAPAWCAGVDVMRVHDVPETLDTAALPEAVWGRGR